MAIDIRTRRIKDEMTKAVVSASPDDDVTDALSLMAEYRVTALPVTDDKNRCVGFLSTADLVDPSRWRDGQPIDGADARLGERKVRDLMTNTVVGIDRETLVLRAAGEMLRHRVHHLPVVDDNQQLLGIVSTMDLLAACTKALDGM